MRKRRMLAALTALIAAGLMVGCNGAAAPAGTVPADEVPVVGEAGANVVAEAVIEPAHWSEVRANAASEVAEVLVEEGQQVEAGQPLAQLDTDDLALQVSQAEASLSGAQAQLAQVLAAPRSEEVAAVRANLKRAEAVLERAQGAYDRVAWRPEISMLPQSLGLEQATLDYEVALADYSLALQGASPEEIAVAEASLLQAEIALEEAMMRLEQATLTAPMAGTVTLVNVEAGDTTAPGEVVVVLATLDHLQARTVDLTELDVVRVVEGQRVTVTVDALPDLELTGYVARIGLQSVDYRGDVTYPVIIELDETAPGLRWGMTVVVEIDVE